MTREVALFLGCLIPYQFPQLELAARKIFKHYDFKLLEIEGASCCPDPVTIQSADILTWSTLAARNICLVEEMGQKEILCLCSGCFETLKSVNELLKKNLEMREKVNEALKQVDKEWKGTVEIRHSLELLYKDIGPEKLKEDAKQSLNGLRVGIHYGCHLVRPGKIIQFDDVENPKSIDEIVVALGGVSVDYPFKMNCCGSVITNTEPRIGYRIGKDKLVCIHDYDVDCITLTCPCCYQQFDWRQPLIKRNYEQEMNFKMPVVSIEELVAIALGITPDELGFKYHRMKVGNVVEKIFGGASS